MLENLTPVAKPTVADPVILPSLIFVRSKQQCNRSECIVIHQPQHYLGLRARATTKYNVLGIPKTNCVTTET